MIVKDREVLALEAIDHGFPPEDRSPTDWQAIAIIHALLAIAEAVDRTTYSDD